jgi:arylmalonate decarboxylase
MSRSKPFLGIVSPRVDNKILAEAAEVFSDWVRFESSSVGVTAMEETAYRAAHARIPAAVDDLVKRGAQAIAIDGTSMTFAFGREFDSGLIAKMRERSGRPVTTMATSLVRGLQVFNAKRVAIAAAYDQTVTGQLVKFLDEHRLRTSSAKNLGIVSMDTVLDVTEERIMDLAEAALAEGQADALVIACGGLRTIPLTKKLEERYAIPVVSSSQAAVWGSLRLIGITDAIAGLGRLFQVAEAA